MLSILLVCTYLVISEHALGQEVENTDIILNTKDTIDYFREQKYPDFARLPVTGKVSTRLPNNVMPVLATWFWGEDQFKPDGYKNFIDTINIHSPYNILAASIRLPGREITNEAVHDQIKLVTEYAITRGIALVADLDVRCARLAFETKYPDELQDMLRLQEVELSGKDTIEIVVHSLDLRDHYTGRTTHYIPLHGSLIRVYSYNMTLDGIEYQSLNDISKDCITAHSSKDSVVVKIPVINKNSQARACVMVSFTHFTPAMFAPHLIEFQREIIQAYADVSLVGVFKDEWGFPPGQNPKPNEFWYSKYRAQAYDGNAALPKSMIAFDNTGEIISEIHEIIKKRYIDLQTPATRKIGPGKRMSYAPPATGFCRLIDGTIIQVAGINKASGDPIHSTIKIKSHKVFFDAVGVAAVRLNGAGQIQAMVAGGLKSFKTGDFEINLDKRTDIALWINDKGKWEGVIQGWNTAIPP